MAARLNTPADFAVLNPAGAGSKQYDLLPPSLFESRSGVQAEHGEPWKDLAKATSEILELRAENKKLREDKQVTLHTSEPIKAQVDVRHEQPANMINQQPQSMSAVNFSHVDQIIQRQAAEVVSLQQKLTQAESSLQKVEARWESERTLREARHEQQVTGLQNDLITLREKHTQELHQSKMELDKCINEKNQKTTELQTALQTSENKAKEEREQLQSNLSFLQKRLETTVRELEETKRLKEHELQEAHNQLSQLKTYVSQTETAHKSSDTWRREHDNLLSKLKVREEEVSQLNQRVELSTVRLQAQDRILTLQEQHLSKVKDESIDKKKNVLLTRWREKVYELMVQAKSAEISSKHQEHNWNLKLQDVSDKLQEVEAELKLKVAAVEDRKAQLKMANHEITNLETELTRAQDIAISLDDKMQHDAQLIHQLAEFTHGLYQKYQETLQRQASIDSSLKAYDQRIGFASGRIYMLQGQFSRKEAILKMQYEEAMKEAPTRDKDPLKESDPSEQEALEAELRRVTEERDALVRQQQEDAQLLESKITAAKQRVEAELQELKDTIDNLHLQMDQKNQVIDDLREQAESVRAELVGVREELDTKKQQAMEGQNALKQETTALLEAERSRCTESLAEMEHRLNECRREQTKAVVSLRQLERASAREKDRAAEHLTTLEKEYKDTISQLEKKLHSVEKDRNILMTTLRQEGLIGQYKAQRPPPVQSEVADQGEVMGTKSTLPPPPTLSDSEPLHDVIDDLKSLTAEVMDDDDELS